MSEEKKGKTHDLEIASVVMGTKTVIEPETEPTEGEEKNAQMDE